MANYTKFAVRGAITVLVVSLMAAFLGYLVRLVLARNLTVEEFGLFYAVFAFLSLLGLFKSFGFDKALIKFIPDFKHEKRNDLIKSSIIYVSIIQLITNTIIIIAIYLFSSYLSVYFFHTTQANIVLNLMAIAFFLDSFVLTLKFVFQGFKKMIYFSGIDFIRMFLILIIILIGLKLNYMLLSPIIAYIVVPLILIVIFGLILLKVFPEFIKSKFVLDKILLKKISKYSVFIMATTVGGTVLGYTDTVVLTYFSGLINVGLYNIALPTAKVLIYFPRAIGGVLWPLTAELWVKRKKLLLKAGIESLYKYSTIVIVPLVFIMFSFTELLINFFFGKDYILAANTMKILSIGMIFANLYVINTNFFSGIEKPQINSKIVYSATVFNLITNLILIPILGIIGAAITTTISYFIMMLMGLIKIRKFVKITYPIKVWIKTLLAGLIFTFIIWLLKKIIFLNVWLETAIVLIISGIVYIGLLFLLKIININEIKDLYKRIAK